MRFPMVALLGVLSGVPASGEVPDKQAVQKPAKKAVTIYIEGDTSTIPPKMRHFQGGAFLERNQASSADASAWPSAVQANRVPRLLPSARQSGELSRGGSNRNADYGHFYECGVRR